MSKKILVTGANGFVAGHLYPYLQNAIPGCTVEGIDIQEGRASIVLDLLDRKRVEAIIADYKPDWLVHLASFSSVAYSWKNPVESFANNTSIFLNLVESLRQFSPHTRLLSVGSSEEYGNIDPAKLPVAETHATQANSPYSAARIAQEHLSVLYATNFGLDIVLTRSFNHTGPGQSTKFAIPSFVKKVLDAKMLHEDKILVGNLDIVRDFTDVRDVVRAYVALLEQGSSGEIYNVCSGKGHSLRHIVDLISRLAGVSLEYVVDKALVRPQDNLAIIGNFKKLKEACSWEPHYSLDDSLVDVYQSLSSTTVENE